MVLIGLTAHILKNDDQWNGKAVHGLYEMETRWIQRAGGTALAFPPLAEPGEAGALMRRLDGLLLLGGGDIGARHYGGLESDLVRNVIDERDESELALTRAALAQGVPILAICRGVQLLNVALGGTLIQDIPTQRPQALAHNAPGGSYGVGSTHDVKILSGSRLEKIFQANTLHVNSFHHQALDGLGQGLSVTATSADGIIEGVELAGHPFCLGVQWHPEKAEGNREDMLPIFQALVDAGRSRQG